MKTIKCAVTYDRIPRNKLHRDILNQFGTVVAASKALGICRVTIQQWIKAGEVPRDARLKSGEGVSRSKIRAAGYNSDDFTEL